MRIKVGNIIIGSKYIPIQTMLKNSINNIDLSLKKIDKLSKIGCDIIRVAVPDEKSIISLSEILKNTKLPVVADIHFDYRLAIKAIEAGVNKIRINPGNIGKKENIKKLIDCLKNYNIPIRIGINCGSLPQHLIRKFPDNSIKVMIESAKEEISYFKKYGYNRIILSFKSSNVMETIKINKLAKKTFDFPLHIGVTEAGDMIDGSIKNSIGISSLLLEGIGDTIRVSLTSNEENEIIVGKKILEAIGRRDSNVEIISCPTCGRTISNVEEIVKSIKEKLLSDKTFSKSLKIAVMGCTVNGPGEAKNADFGVACGYDQSIIFKNGKKLKIIKNSSILDELLLIMNEYYEK